MENIIQGIPPALALAGFTFVLFALVIWKRSSYIGGVSRRGVRNMILLGGVLFLVVLPLVWAVVPQPSIAENIGVALFIAIFVTGTSIAMWMGAT